MDNSWHVIPMNSCFSHWKIPRDKTDKQSCIISEGFFGHQSYVSVNTNLFIIVLLRFNLRVNSLSLIFTFTVWTVNIQFIKLINTYSNRLKYIYKQSKIFLSALEYCSIRISHQNGSRISFFYSSEYLAGLESFSSFVPDIDIKLFTLECTSFVSLNYFLQIEYNKDSHIHKSLGNFLGLFSSF